MLFGVSIEKLPNKYLDLKCHVMYQKYPRFLLSGPRFCVDFYDLVSWKSKLLFRLFREQFAVEISIVRLYIKTIKNIPKLRRKSIDLHVSV